MIESAAGKWYYGSTENVIQRVADHNSNRAKWTRFKGPWELIFRRDFEDKSEALKFEFLLKRMRNKNYIRTSFSEYFLK
ncbi:MAG: GIY-YIG nuclease family protein [Cyclobacteriaceae bacterium]|nr:GIY-YIG nuclease family protein [Cyclobacteriaceae bacterium]